MHTLADAIVYLNAYLNLAGIDPEDGHTIDCDRDDDDAKALEWFYCILDSATSAEFAALRAAAERAIAEENAAGSPRPDWLAQFEDFVKDLKERRPSTETN
jgi:hypothetical protein